MTQEIVERIIDETVDTIIDSIDEKTVDYMFEYGDYKETDDQFVEDLRVFKKQVITELFNRINNKQYVNIQNYKSKKTSETTKSKLTQNYKQKKVLIN